MRFMSFPTWRKAILGLKTAGEEVHLCPHWLGEPTLHPQFDQFVEYAFAVNHKNSLFRSFKLHTNAVIFSSERAQRLIRLASLPHLAPDTFRAIHFSIDAFTASTYTFIKGVDHRDKVYRNIERFLQIRKERGTPKPAAHIAFVVQDGNHKEAKTFVEYWSERLDSYRLCTDWPPFDKDAIYLRRWNTGDQTHADRLHKLACEEIGLSSEKRRAGSF